MRVEDIREVRLLKAIADDPEPLVVFAILKCIVDNIIDECVLWNCDNNS